MKMLRVIHSVNSAHAMDVVSTFCGAHSVPVGMTADEATEDVVAVQIPELVVREQTRATAKPARLKPPPPPPPTPPTPPASATPHLTIRSPTLPLPTLAYPTFFTPMRHFVALKYTLPPTSRLC
jgi:hypothetical protein